MCGEKEDPGGNVDFVCCHNKVRAFRQIDHPQCIDDLLVGGERIRDVGRFRCGRVRISVSDRRQFVGVSVFSVVSMELDGMYCTVHVMAPRFDLV